MVLAAVLLVLQADDGYPNALVASSKHSYKLFPPYLRRDTFYRTPDAFPAVYNWYSSRLGLGPEARAMSRCISMERSRRVLFVNRYVAATVCDTPNGRMIFVQRTLWLR